MFDDEFYEEEDEGFSEFASPCRYCGDLCYSQDGERFVCDECRRGIRM